MKIAYCFGDHGAETEVLSRFGDVHRYTIDPVPNPHVEETIQMDLMNDRPSGHYDLFWGHPSCAPWAETTSIDGNPDDHENQVPRAREIARDIADHYVIENVPRGPLRHPVTLKGDMFGLPIEYERAFETSFNVEQPVVHMTFGNEVSPYFYSDRSADWWAAVKGYTGDYPKQHLAKNCVPSDYARYILRHWLGVVNGRDGQPARSSHEATTAE